MRRSHLDPGFRGRLFAALLAVAAALVPNAAKSDLVTYRYTGGLLIYTPPGTLPGQPPPNAPSPFGERMLGSVTFDDSLVTGGFTGTITSGFTYTLGTTTLTPSGGGGSLPGAPASLTFSAGSISSWFLRSEQTIVFYLVPLLATSSGDSIFPITGGLVLGSAAGPAGTWALAPPAAVPLPPTLFLLAGGVAALAMTGRRRGPCPSRRDSIKRARDGHPLP